MEELIRSGADVSHLSLEELMRADTNGGTALSYAVKWDRPDAVRHLHGLGVNLKKITLFWSGGSPMGQSICHDSRRAAATLFWAGARPMGWTCAEYAIYRDKPALAEWFIFQGEPPPKSDNTAIGTEQLDEWRRQFCACRSLVVAWLGVKRFRGQALVHVDRFLMRHMAEAIWQTRGEDKWAMNSPYH